MASRLAKFAEDKGIKYFMISFTDLFGGQRAKLVCRLCDLLGHDPCSP